jgi:hypothetical protein
MAGMNTAQQGTHSAATMAADPRMASSIEILRRLLSGQYGGLRIYHRTVLDKCFRCFQCVFARSAFYQNTASIVRCPVWARTLAAAGRTIGGRFLKLV